ncbi:EamA domain-containing membrane protein RarD [Hydrogenimonas thermophila]|uniref:EamA domain-containing membrane protein RarD n=2 Tax=Hydrogenimonas thermophila TaxID=223786 RepID=A0A1I5M881_9BACT|nr:EamA domain-containing membrane protein RarD [Hydrogenimonas thermophila]
MKARLLKIDAGVRYMLFASLMFALMGAFAKMLSSHLPSIEVVFFRNVFGFFLVAATILKKPMTHTGGKPFLLLFRGLMGFLALLAFFYNIGHIPLGDAMTYSKTSPIFTALFAWIFLKEALGVRGWLALAIGFIGIVLIAKPTGMMLDKTAWLGIFSGVGAALAYTAVRELRQYYDTRAIVLSFMGVGTVGPLVLMALSPYVATEELDMLFASFVMPSGVEWGYIIMLGLFATLAQIYMTKAYAATQAGIVGAVSYSNILFSIMVGLLIGDPFPDPITWGGIALIVTAGIIVARKK